MTDRKRLEWFEIEDADYDFDFFDEKEVISEMLNNQAPKSVENFDSTGTQWDLYGDIDDYFDLYIEGAHIQTQDCIGDFIEDFLNFLPQLAFTDNKSLLCPFDDEGSAYMLLTTPVDNCNIRVSVFHSEMIENYREKKFLADILINKDTFLKQMLDILQMAADVSKKPRNTYSNWVDKIKYTIKELDKYFKNPDEFKKNYQPKRHIRVFDVAYKTPENMWEFGVYLEGDEQADITYWENLKSDGKILDYDFSEQFSANLFYWNKSNKALIKLPIEKIRKKLKTKMSDRIEKNWVYSRDTKQWYSENEVMPIPKQKIKSFQGQLKYDVCIDSKLYSNPDEQIKSYVDSYKEYGDLNENYIECLICRLKIKCAKKIICDIEFDYRKYKQIIQALEKAETCDYIRFSLGGYDQDKMHLWSGDTESSNTVIVACFHYLHKKLYAFEVDKKQFIECFKNALNDITDKIISVSGKDVKCFEVKL